MLLNYGSHIGPCMGQSILVLTRHLDLICRILCDISEFKLSETLRVLQCGRRSPFQSKPGISQCRLQLLICHGMYHFPPSSRPNERHARYLLDGQGHVNGRQRNRDPASTNDKEYIVARVEVDGAYFILVRAFQEHWNALEWQFLTADNSSFSNVALQTAGESFLWGDEEAVIQLLRWSGNLMNRHIVCLLLPSSAWCRICRRTGKGNKRKRVGLVEWEARWRVARYQVRFKTPFGDRWVGNLGRTYNKYCQE